MSKYASDDSIDLFELLRVSWKGRWIIVGTAIAFLTISGIYAVTASKWYQAEVLLAPAKDSGVPALGGDLGSLAALAGVSVGDNDSIEPLASLKSRSFARKFIEEQSLLPVLLTDEWDEIEKSWKGDDPDRWPDIRDGVEFFHDEVLSVRDERQTGLVTLGIAWTDPNVASAWANELARRLNRDLRQDALAEAEANIEYLRAELAKTNVVTLQQSIGRLLETELQKMMLARGNEEFAFRVIDPAVPPKDAYRPRRILIVLFFTILGSALALLYVLASHYLGASPENSKGTEA